MIKFKGIPTEEEIKLYMAYEQQEKEKIKRYAKEQGISYKKAEEELLVRESLGMNTNKQGNSKSGCLGVMVVMIVVASYILS